MPGGGKKLELLPGTIEDPEYDAIATGRGYVNAKRRMG